MHGLDADEMHLCNPRDREAARGAEAEGIATANLTSVTCVKCRTLLHRARREVRGRRT